MEATGNYYEDVANYLTTSEDLIHVAHPLKIHAYIQSRFKRIKTDK